VSDDLARTSRRGRARPRSRIALDASGCPSFGPARPDRRRPGGRPALGSDGPAAARQDL